MTKVVLSVNVQMDLVLVLMEELVLIQSRDYVTPCLGRYCFHFYVCNYFMILPKKEKKPNSFKVLCKCNNILDPWDNTNILLLRYLILISHLFKFFLFFMCKYIYSVHILKIAKNNFETYLAYFDSFFMVFLSKIHSY